MSDTPKFNIFSGFGGFSAVAVVDLTQYTEGEFDAEVSRVEKVTGMRLGITSNAGLPENQVRLTFLPSDAFNDPNAPDTTVYKKELELGDVNGGVMIVHPDTKEILSWGDRPIRHSPPVTGRTKSKVPDSHKM